MWLNHDDFGIFYHESYNVLPSQLKRQKIDWKKLKNIFWKSRSISGSRTDRMHDDTKIAPEIELPGNPSAFAVFASIRLAVLDRWMHHCNEEYLKSNRFLYIQDQIETESDTDDISQIGTSITISKVVGLGLRSVFELIKETRVTHPSLCAKALSALLNVLQGQSPEGLNLEPSEVINPLFDLLLALATLHGPESSVPNNGSHLTAVACASLLSLVVVRGDTGKYLSAVAALLMCPRALSLQNIQMSPVLCSLQNSVYAVLLKKSIRPDWITHGVPNNSAVDCFVFKYPTELTVTQMNLKSLACDGQYFYLFSCKGLFKIGTGFGGTIKGHIVLWKSDFYPNDNGVLVHCADHLYLKLNGRRSGELLIVDKTNLLITNSILMHTKDASSAIFSDGSNLGIISQAKDDNFVVRMLNQNISPAPVVSEFPLKLVKKCLKILGTAAFEDEIGYPHNFVNDEEIADIISGKEFGLIRTYSGKVFFCGKSSAFGIKHSGTKAPRWSDLILMKSPKIKHIAVGHDGLHAILITEDGSVFFAGTSRRGEDGDQSKVRRQSKPIKPKKMVKVDNHRIVAGSCNNGTTALITANGELIMFGKDTLYSDHTTGLVTSLKEEFIIQVALGKAHTLALTDKGQVYTFGINNKYQCGRDFQSSKDGIHSQVVSMDCGIQEELDFCETEPSKESSNVCQFNKSLKESLKNICPHGIHSWRSDMCMICSVCRECTGYSSNCLSLISSERNPGEECGCGEGDSGCEICGCCRVCAWEMINNSELVELSGIMKHDLKYPDKAVVRPANTLKEQLSNSDEPKRSKLSKSIQSVTNKYIKTKSSISSSNNVLGPTKKISIVPERSTLDIVKDQSDVERDATKISSLPPSKITLPTNSPVVEIACGLHHSILLLQNGQVYTFGSNSYGQLGCGDIFPKTGIHLVKLPTNAIHIAAGSNHSVILTSRGEVFTFGNAQKGQLGRLASDYCSEHRLDCGQTSASQFSNRMPWYSIPEPIPNIGPKFCRKATWIGASGDQTFLKLDENLINSISLMKSVITANKNSLVLLPKEEEIARSFKCIVINKKDGNCRSFKDQDQVNFINKMVCMDHIYNVLWSYNPSCNKFTCYNIILSELEANVLKKTNTKLSFDENSVKQNEDQYSLRLKPPYILYPELALPTVTNCYVTRFQAAINLLSCLDILNIAYELRLPISKECTQDNQFMPNKSYSKDDFQVVNRFESHGGGWGYSGHSIEAIRFMADTDVMLGGYGLFGGRGEYTAKLRLIDIGPDGGEQEIDGEILAETEEIQYECGPRQKYLALFDKPIHLQAHRWYVAWCRITGPSSDCGSSGQTMVVSEDQVIFYFKSSKKSNNGTDVNAGQIPQLMFKVVAHETQSPVKQKHINEFAHMLSKSFFRTVSKECFQSLLSLLQWSWNTFKCGVMEGQTSKQIYNNLDLEKLVYISRASLRLICTYINEIYPRRINKRIITENTNLVECIRDSRMLIKQILSDNLPLTVQNHSKKADKNNIVLNMINDVLDECHNTFVSCFHTFYPTAILKWNYMCDLLRQTKKDSSVYPTSNQRLLCALFCALCAPSIRLRTIFPLFASTISNENFFYPFPCSSDNIYSPTATRNHSHHYPLLIEKMTDITEVNSTFYPWPDVLDCLINLASNPVVKKLKKCNETTQSRLTKFCCHLLAKILAELVFQGSSTEDEWQSYDHTLYVTPSRFTRINQSRTWNTGNGSPDAICFHVDRDGISIVGIGIYGGIGHYEYEVELLEDTSTVNSELVPTQRWNCLEIVRGSYDHDDYAPEITEIKFDRAVPIKESVKYAIRLRNHGGRTNNGDGGLTSIKAPDNTTFTFSTCSLSFNGTTVTRGQIPVLLFYSHPLESGRNSTSKSEEARKVALSMASCIINKANRLMVLAREKAEETVPASILSNSSFISSLLPQVLAHITPLVASDSKTAVLILNSIQEILPHVAALNLMEGCSPISNIYSKNLKNSNETPDIFDSKINTTSNYYTIVESDHPYKAATVANYRVRFPESVKWMSLEFDASCSTVQPEDCVQVYIPENNHCLNKSIRNLYLDDIDNLSPHHNPVFKFSGSLQWPTNSVILPGNEVTFSLESASNYMKNDRYSDYGFKCLVVGYELPMEGNLNSGLKQLEAELSFLGGMCTASLMKKDLYLPPAEDDCGVDKEVAEFTALEIFTEHSSLLAKGLSLSSPPTIQQALDGTLPYSTYSNEQLFLRDFVSCKTDSSGGRLAQWLQPGSRVDPSNCQILFSQELHFGWPAVITVLTRDQYSELVYVSNMKVEVKAIPIDKMELGGNNAHKMRKVNQSDILSFGGLPPPPLQHPYEPTIRDKMCFHSITAMKPYQNYSFEEIRFTSPPIKRSIEIMTVKSNCDGSYVITWTPASVGSYSIIATIDGYDMEEVFTVEVKEPPQGLLPPNQSIVKKYPHKPNKLRKFVAKNSAGLRIRAHPSLQSEQIGVVCVNGTISYIDEVHNDDGVWLRLSADTIRQYCSNSIIEAWCLQYNQHLGKTLLLPVDEPKTIIDQALLDTIMGKLPQIQEGQKNLFSKINYQVIKCGASGHNIRSRPSLKAPPVGMLILGNIVGAIEYTINSDGCWVLLDEVTKEKYCFNREYEAWSLAIGPNNILYLGNITESDTDFDISPLQKRGYNFFHSISKLEENNFSFSKQDSSHLAALKKTNEASLIYPFIFGGTSFRTPNLSIIERKDVKLMTKCFGKANNSYEDVSDKLPIDSSVNGNSTNGVDSTCLNESINRSSSTDLYLESTSKATEPIPETITKIQVSGEIDGGKQIISNTSSNSFDTLFETEKRKNSVSEPIEVAQAGTQTSPDSITIESTKTHFSIGTNGKEEKVLPKTIRKDRIISKVRSKRSIPPHHAPQSPLNLKNTHLRTENIKHAMSPSMAESLRAVFAALLWHEGIVHDAMACASFLKFHPNLPRQGEFVIENPEMVFERYKELNKEEKARQRHSVEVTNAENYLHIQPSTLESLTRSAANANANRNRRKVIGSFIKEEEKTGHRSRSQTSVLPPALYALVFLWEEVISNLPVDSKEIDLSSPIQKTDRKIKKTENRPRSDNRDINYIIDKENKKCKKKKVSARNCSEDIGFSGNLHSSAPETFCELCGYIFDYPVTYHMHQVHPGCGLHACGKGYNSSGKYCLGWSGNCGDGGVPGSSWYLLCENCRQKYVKLTIGRKSLNTQNKFCTIKSDDTPKIAPQSSFVKIESHIIMKDNAMFLLDLQSAADSNIRRRRSSSVITMPSLSENISPPETTEPFSSLPPFHCQSTLNGNFYNNDPSVLRSFLNEQIQETPGQRPLSEAITLDSSDKGLRFHRSVSMGTNGVPWSKSGCDGRVIMTRKRNSSCDINGGSSLLCNPSSALRKLMENVKESNNSDCSGQTDLLQKPVLKFILQHHDLDSLQFSMKRALRKAICRAYAMQALNWLLRSVTQPICLHDLLWWLIISLTPIEVDSEAKEDNSPLNKDDQDTTLYDHPLSDITIAGDSIHPLPLTFHSLLQTIAELMVLLPIGSALQQIAVRCWGIRFTSSDHTFLHRSQVFSIISKILTKSEEVEALSMYESCQRTLHKTCPSVECLKDLTSTVELKVSSRQAMVGSLIDNSTETFWESGDEDRNKTKSITIICSHGHHPTLVCVHIDNCRDIGYKVSSITFLSGQNMDELIKLKTIEVQSRSLGGWIHCPVTGCHDNVVKLDLKGPDNSVRVRQIRVLGNIEGEMLQVTKQCNSLLLQQKNCEAEALRVFKLITSQVFGKLLKGEDGENLSNTVTENLSTSESNESHEGSNDLREHMVGILFSRSKLTHLQKQVIVHIVQSLRKETERVYEEWESNLNNTSTCTRTSQEILKSSDTYCFEMLSMVLALSGSSVGRTYLSQQWGLLGDLIALLHIGSARVQRQVTSLLRRMLCEITPETFAKVVGVTKLPAKEFGVIPGSTKDLNSEKFNINELGILDPFLSIIAKALTLQVKVKCKGTSSGVNTVSLTSAINQQNDQHERWWLKGSVYNSLAEEIIQLIKEMASGKLSELWARVTKCAIAENILNLTYLSDDQKLPDNCLQTPTVWLALASLCVLDEDHVEKLSSGWWKTSDGQAMPPRPTCNNHDDEETIAIIQCNACGNLCAECDRYLHLHRKSRNHQRQVCKEEEEAIKVEIHEGCGRIKLFWLLALADSKTLKALIEFREGGTRTNGIEVTGVCRFCGTTENSGLLAIGNVCANHECQEYGKTACPKVLNCGHMCGGVLGETKCLPCLYGCSTHILLKQDSDDMCMICFTEALSCAPAIQLQCGHVFHSHCCKAVLQKKWPGPRITFSFLLCPICKEEINHEILNVFLTPLRELYQDVRRKALMRLEYEGLRASEAKIASNAFHSDSASYAMDKYAYYVCYKCNKAYYGGEARCDSELGDKYDPTELVCGACSDVARAQMCPKHGTDFLEYKCRYCCSVAIFFCFGTTHFCNLCHDDFQRVTNLTKSELPICPAGPRAIQLDGDECPLHVKHPPTGEEFALGCGICRNAHTF